MDATRTRGAAVIGLALMLMLSGCAGLFDGGQQTPTTTPEPTTTTTPTQTPTNSVNASFPPGVTMAGVNETKLAMVHAEQLRKSGSFEMEFSEQATVGNTTQTRNITMMAETQAPEAIVTFSQQGGLTTFYHNKDAAYSRTMGENGYEYSQVNTSQTRVEEFTTRRGVGKLLATGDFEVTEVKNKTRNGEKLLVLEAASPDQDVISVDPVSYHAIAVVGESGKVYYVNYYISWLDGKTVKQLSVTVKYYNFGSVAVPTPDWVEKAKSGGATNSTAG